MCVRDDVRQVSLRWLFWASCFNWFLHVTASYSKCCTMLQFVAFATNRWVNLGPLVHPQQSVPNLNLLPTCVVGFNKSHTSTLCVWCATQRVRLRRMWQMKGKVKHHKWRHTIVQFCKFPTSAPVSFPKNIPAHIRGATGPIRASRIGDYKGKNVFQITFIFHCQNWDTVNPLKCKISLRV